VGGSEFIQYVFMASVRWPRCNCEWRSIDGVLRLVTSIHVPLLLHMDDGGVSARWPHCMGNSLSRETVFFFSCENRLLATLRQALRGLTGPNDPNATHLQ